MPVANEQPSGTNRMTARNPTAVAFITPCDTCPGKVTVVEVITGATSAPVSGVGAGGSSNVPNCEAACGQTAALSGRRPGAEAPPLRESDAPAAVLLDLRRPGLDGFEFLDRMRESRYHKGIPVIAITVKRLTPEEEAQLADKASAVVIKDENFVPRIRAFLNTLFPMETRKSPAEPTSG